MEEDRPYTDTHLFTVRVWAENIGGPDEYEVEWRGKVCHVASGGTGYFRDWTAFITLMQQLAGELEGNLPATLVPAPALAMPVARD